MSKEDVVEGDGSGSTARCVSLSSLPAPVTRNSNCNVTTLHDIQQIRGKYIL